MLIHFKTRQLARSFASKGKTKGLPRKLVDNGTRATKRWSVDVSKQA